MSPIIEKNRDDQGARNRLLEAAVTIFCEKGYASTAVREIVALAGVTKPVLYYYFKSKEGIFRAILDGAAELQEMMLAEVLDRPGGALDRLIFLYQRTYQGVLEYKNLFKMIHNLMFGPPQGTPPYDFGQYHRRMVNTIKAIYLEGMAVGEVVDADPEDVAVLVLGLIDFAFHLERVDPESADPERPERLLGLAFKGLLKKED